MGESKNKLVKCKEMLMSCAGVQTMAGRGQVRWDTESAATPMGQLAYFIEFLTLTGLWSRWLESCPLSYNSPNAPSKADELGDQDFRNHPYLHPGSDAGLAGGRRQPAEGRIRPAGVGSGSGKGRGNRRGSVAHPATAAGGNAAETGGEAGCRDQRREEECAI